jgi:hypothetical protein
MKTLKNTFRTSMIVALIAMVSIASSYANDSTDLVTRNLRKESKEFLYMKELVKESDLMRFERDLISEGVITCEGTTKVKVLGVNDEIVYEGEVTAFDNANIQLQKWINKADFIITVGDTSFYKIF